MKGMLNSVILQSEPLSEREKNLRERPPTPPVWRSYFHVVYTLVFCIVGMILAVRYTVNLQPIDLLMVPVSFVVANFVEYFIHRWPMHRKYPGAEVMLRLHMVHHNYFYEDTYRINEFRDYAMIVFPPIVLNILAFGLAPLIGAGIWWLLGKNAALLFYASVLGYYLLMQLIHVLCHLDPRNKAAHIPGIRYLWNHHNVHHTKRCMAKANFNFIVPLADIVMGTNAQSVDSIKR
jgi:Fatty acid hydroxylase superfamily